MTNATGEPDFLSAKDIASSDRLIFALDVSGTDETKRLVEHLGDSEPLAGRGQLEACVSGNLTQYLGMRHGDFQ